MHPWQKLLLMAICISFLPGCGAMRNYNDELTLTTDAWKTGNITGALQILEENNPGEEKDILYYFEKGELLRYIGNVDASTEAWRTADTTVVAWEDAVRADPDKYLAEFGAYIVNDKTRRYEGQDFEKVMLSTQLALNHAATGNLDAARIEIKKTHEREALIQNLRDKEYAKVQEDTKTQNVQNDISTLNGYPVATLDSAEVLALKNSYQNALSHYLAGFIYESLGEKGLAAPGYRNAIELKPNTPALEQALLALDPKPVSKTKKKAKPAPQIPQTDLLVVVESGLAPGRNSIFIPLPIPTGNGISITSVSFPVIQEHPEPALPVAIQSAAGVMPLTEITSVDAMSRRALRDDMPGIILRTTVRAVTRAIIQDQVNQQAGQLAGLAVAAAGMITEQADERVWRTLPDKVSIARFKIPSGKQELALNVGTGAHKVVIDANKPHQIVSLRLVGGQLYAVGGEIVRPLPVVAPAALPTAQTGENNTKQSL